MSGVVDGATETRSEQRARLRLRQIAGEWFPTVDAGVLDRVVAAGWLEAREQAGSAGSKRIAIVAAAAVRRDGLRALRGEEFDLPKDAEERIAALSAHEPLAAESLQRRRRARPEALGRRAPAPPEPEPATPRDPIALKRDHDGEDEPPPTRRRRARHHEQQAAVESPPENAEPGIGSRTLRILADTVHVVTGREARANGEPVETVARARNGPTDVAPARRAATPEAELTERPSAGLEAVAEPVAAVEPEADPDVIVEPELVAAEPAAEAEEAAGPEPAEAVESALVEQPEVAAEPQDTEAAPQDVTGGAPAVASEEQWSEPTEPPTRKRAAAASESQTAASGALRRPLDGPRRSRVSTAMASAARRGDDFGRRRVARGAGIAGLILLVLALVTWVSTESGDSDRAANTLPAPSGANAGPSAAEKRRAAAQAADRRAAAREQAADREQATAKRKEIATNKARAAERKRRVAARERRARRAAARKRRARRAAASPRAAPRRPISPAPPASAQAPVVPAPVAVPRAPSRSGRGSGGGGGTLWGSEFAP